MAHPDSRVTIHMAASLDGFIARKDGRRGPRANPHARTMEFSLRDPDGFHVAFILSVRALLSLRSGHSVPPRPAPAP